MVNTNDIWKQSHNTFRLSSTSYPIEIGAKKMPMKAKIGQKYQKYQNEHDDYDEK